MPRGYMGYMEDDYMSVDGQMGKVLSYMMHKCFHLQLKSSHFFGGAKEVTFLDHFPS